MREVDQRDVQKRGGVCARFPVSCLLHDMLRSSGTKHDIVLDVTFGEGRFYGAWRPKVLLGTDIRVLDWVVDPDWFARCPSWSAWARVKKLGVKPDLIVVDPPFTRNSMALRRHFQLNRALGDEKMILDGAVTTAVKLGTRVLLVHFNDLYIPRGWELSEAIKFKFYARRTTQRGDNYTYFYIMHYVGESET